MRMWHSYRHTHTNTRTHTDTRLCAKVCLRLMAIVNCLAALFISIIHHQPHCAQWNSTSIEVTEMQLKLTAAYSNTCETYMFIQTCMCVHTNSRWSDCSLYLLSCKGFSSALLGLFDQSKYNKWFILQFHVLYLLTNRSCIHLPGLFFSFRLLYELSITLLALTFHGLPK